jgi:uncharacterized protein with PIN domain
MAFYFAADRTLGKLAKWLRILGFDTTFEIEVPAELFYENLEKDRIVLTRTGTIKKQFRAHRLVFITSNYLDVQLKQVIAEIGICPAHTRPFSRCIDCNVPIVDADPDDVCGLIPDYIYEINNAFHKCLQCNRIFWPGSHTKRGLERIEQLFKYS